MHSSPVNLWKFIEMQSTAYLPHLLHWQTIPQAILFVTILTPVWPSENTAVGLEDCGHYQGSYSAKNIKIQVSWYPWITQLAQTFNQLKVKYGPYTEIHRQHDLKQSALLSSFCG